MVRRCVPFLVPALLAAASPAAAVRKHYDAKLAPRLVPLASEVLRFPTVAGDTKAWEDQKAWLMKVGRELGFTVKDAGKVTEIELPASTPGPEGAPVLGLVVHGDVQPVDDHWTIPPFSGAVKDGNLLGRGAADDKGPLVQALLAMKALADAGPRRTHTIRLLMGSDEESANTDFTEYLAAHQPPDYTLVLDSAFPVVVGEKAWNALTVTTDLKERAGAETWAYTVADLHGGLATSIVPDMASVVLAGKTTPLADARGLARLAARLKAKPLPPGIRLELREDAGRNELHVITHGRAAHGGVNLEGGRNALVALAQLMEGELPPGGADDLLAFARQAGRDLYGTGLGLVKEDPLWGRCAVNVATIKPAKDGRSTLTVNVRAIPGLTGPELQAHLQKVVADFASARHGAMETGGFFGDTVLAFDPQSKLVKRLMAAYTRATGKTERPAISGGGTYAKRIPRAIAFGMWFPGKAYPGHDVDEQVPVADLHRGTHVLIEALVDLACGAPLKEPFKP